MELKQPEVGGKFMMAMLLIVPYGIETGSDWHKCAEIQAFNRTLWN